MNRPHFIYIIGTILVISYFTHGCSPHRHERMSGNEKDSLKTLAALPGAHMTMYNLYIRQIEDGAKEAASASAETFLNNIDTSAVHPILAEMAGWLCEYHASEKNAFSVSARWGERALRIYKDLEDKASIAQISYIIGKSYREINRFDKALLYSLSALSYFEAHKDTLSAMPCYNLLGQIYHFCQEPQISKQYFEKYEKTARALNDTLHMIYSLNNLALMTSTPKDTVRTRQLLREAIHLSLMYKDTTLYVKMIMSMISSYSNANETGKLEQALPMLLQMQDYLPGTKNQITYYYSLGTCFFRLGRLQEAAHSLEKAIDICKTGEFDYYMQSCYYMLQGVYLNLGNIEKAYFNLQNYTRTSRQILSLQSYLQLFKYQNELILTHEQEALKEKQLKHIFTTILAAAILAIILIIYVTILRRRNLKIKAKEMEFENIRLTQANREQEIKSQNELIELQRLQQFRVTRMRNDVTDKLLKIAHKYQNLPVYEEIEEVCRDLQPDGDEGMKELSEFIPKFNSDFFKKLLQDYPDLTINERRLCALLNMNLTTKEISDITKQTVHSINIARGRLRSKLGIIGEHISIQEFLAKYN